MEKRQFTVDPSIIFSLITAQAGTLAKALLECVMNSVDAGAQRVDIVFDQLRLKVVDDGRGFRSISEIDKYFEVFGFDHKSDALQSSRVYGAFGIGRAQLWAFAKTVWRTSTFLMDVDIKHSGLDYGRRVDLEPIQGVTIEGTFYEALSARDVMLTERDLAELCRYVPIPVFVNGKRISTEMHEVEWTHETDDAWIRIKEGGDFAVFNLGVLVRRYPSRHFGAGGEVVTKPGVRLALNMARNDVLVSQCPVWKRIRPFIQARADTVVAAKRKSSGEVEAAKVNLIQRVISGEDLLELGPTFLSGAKLVTDVTGRHLTLQKAFAERISKAAILANSLKDPRGVRIAESSDFLVVAPITLERFGVETMSELLAQLRDVFGRLRANSSSKPAQWLDGWTGFESYDEAGLALDSDYGIVPEAKWTKDERACLAALRPVADYYIRREVSMRLHGDWNCTRIRRLIVGESSSAVAWTDGSSYIAINRQALKHAKNGLAGFAYLTGVLLHEYLHDVGSAGSHVHDEEFYANFHDLMLSPAGSQYAGLALREYHRECRRRDIKMVRRVIEGLDHLDMVREDAGDITAPEAPCQRSKPPLQVATQAKRARKQSGKPRTAESGQCKQLELCV